MAKNEAQVLEATEETSVEFTRQADIVGPEDLTIPITVIGAGGIGSFAIDALTKMGCSNITVFDHDKVEPHNMPNQRFSPSNMGMTKVEAIQNFAFISTGTKINAVPRRWTKEDELSDIVISAVDSMRTRKQIWKKVRYNPAVRLFIDGRIGGENSEVYALAPVDPDRVKFYAKTLFSDKNAAELPCTARAVIFVGFGIAAEISLVVRLFAKGLRFPRLIRRYYRNVNMEVEW